MIPPDSTSLNSPPSPPTKRNRYRLDPSQIRDFPLRHIPHGREVLVALDQHALLTNGQIARLLFDGQANADGELRALYAAEKAAAKQLHRLWESRLLDRKSVILSSKRTGLPYHHFVNVLTAQGAAAVEEHYCNEGTTRPLRWTRTTAEISNQSVEHILAINDAYVLVQRACDRAGVRLFGWRDDRQLSAMQRARETYFISIPDAFFALARGGRVHGYFLEIDLGTESIGGERSTRIWREKIDGYGHYLRDRYRDELFFEGIPMPFVLTITTTTGRLEHMLDETRAIAGAVHCWYTTADAISPEVVIAGAGAGRARPGFDPEVFWRPIWRSIDSPTPQVLPGFDRDQTP
jgi:hypothetical protein